ncbi:MAG: hypothetical protein ABIE42_06940 [Candidatus Eisenbacteria bacterium]
MAWYAEEIAYGLLPVAIQNAIVARHGRRIYRDRFGAGYDELSRLLEESERGDPELHRAYQNARLAELIAHAYETVPYYREVMDARSLTPSDITRVEDLAKLPVLRKEDVQAAGDRLISRAANRRALRRGATSASTGMPLTVTWDRAVAMMNHASYMRLRRWVGAPIGRPYATMQGRIVAAMGQKRPPFWRENPAWNQTFYSTLHMSEANLVHYVANLRRSGAEMLEAYPSSAFALARFLESRGEYLPFKGLITTGEPLLSVEREIIEERFQTRAYDSYGQAERVAFSSECEEHAGHHVYPEYGIAEVVGESGETLPAGQSGLLVGTGLHNYAMPLIRYACGDVAALSERSCPCGRTLPLMEGVLSRVGDLIVTPDGRTVPPIMVSWVVRWIEGVTQYQIRQDSVEELRMLVVTPAPITDEERRNVHHHFERRLGRGMRVTVERVDDIPRSDRGKKRLVVSRVPLPWGGGNLLSGQEEGEGGFDDRADGGASGDAHTE